MKLEKSLDHWGLRGPCEKQWALTYFEKVIRVFLDWKVTLSKAYFKEIPTSYTEYEFERRRPIIISQTINYDNV